MTAAHLIALVILTAEAALLIVAMVATIAVSVWIAVKVGSVLPVAGAATSSAPAWRLRVVVDQFLILDDRQPLRGGRRAPPARLAKAA